MADARDGVASAAIAGAAPRCCGVGAAGASPESASMSASRQTPPATALVLSGGGARAAYQVGVLRAIARLRRRHGGVAAGPPCDIYVGTSAGAINAAVLATHADDFDFAVRRLAGVWARFEAAQVYRADAWGVIRTGARWLTLFSLGWAVARWRRGQPRALLDNEPLVELLQRLVPLRRLPQMLADGHLRALAVTASNYARGEHVTFYTCADAIPSWRRTQRVAIPTPDISHAHLLASAAIPFIFPARHLDGALPGWYGDGAMRQSAPLSPAIHLGAQRLLIIGAGQMQGESGRAPLPASTYPSLAQIGGHVLSSIFLDALAMDVERMERINRTVALLPAGATTALRPVRSLLIAPSQRLDDIAAGHLDCLSTPVRAMLRSVGVHAATGGGAALASYLLFEAPYTRALMALGEADVAARRAEVLDFFGWSQDPIDAGASGFLPERG